MIYSVTFRVEDQGRTKFLLERLQRKIVFIFCNQIFDEYIIDGPITDVEMNVILEFFGSDRSQIHNQNGTISFIYVKCVDNPNDHLQSARAVIEKNRGLIQSGYQIKHFQYYSIIVFGEEQLSLFKSDLNKKFESEIIMERKLRSSKFQSEDAVLSVKNIVETLSEMQRDVILKCIREEYYANPRKIHIQDIAKEMDKSRTSIQRVFRSAENKIMDSLIPHLFMFFKAENP